MTSDDVFVIVAKAMQMMVKGASGEDARDYLLRALSEKQVSLLPDEPAVVPPAPNQTAIYVATARRIFEFWRTMTGRKQSKNTPERQTAVIGRLRDGYTEDDIKSAIAGCLTSSHHRGENESGQPYNDLELICRNGSKLEGFMLRSRGAEFASESKAEELRRKTREMRGR